MGIGRICAWHLLPLLCYFALPFLLGQKIKCFLIETLMKKRKKIDSIFSANLNNLNVALSTEKKHYKESNFFVKNKSMGAFPDTLQ